MTPFHGKLCACCIAVLLLLAAELRHIPDGNARWHFLDVGQGDATLLITPSGKTVLFDGGPDLKVLEHLGSGLSFFNRRIDLLVLSHPNLDHLAGFPDILERYEVGAVLLPAMEYPIARYRRLLSQLEEDDITVLFADTGQSIDTGDGMSLDVLWPPDGWYQREKRKDPNDASVVVRVRYKNHTALITGDISIDIEGEILRRGSVVRADLLKVSHHGSKHSSSTGFLLAVGAADAVISAGERNRFGHPHPDALGRLRATVSGSVLRTDRDGSVKFTWK